ncbi:MAG: hypothetical protein CMB80_06350 [Flammeovirgaceae bacterium]|nr:hypothetical protein [Flammeovirgaceae bacterium]MBR09614.1 hypothetical protein [Rickettsiales bacterium]HCX24405.1 hypothetical protein [Cytophagales bacterium]|tara:strand:- start:3084 stop:3527 length:444 start_codon:yes stop_codon:yes gene_type:complete
MKIRCLIVALTGFILTSCFKDEVHNPLVGEWVLNRLTVGDLIIPMDDCISQSEIIVTAKTNDYGYLVRYTYYWENNECRLYESEEKWDQTFGDYTLDDGNIVDQNETISLTNEDELVYYYDDWEFIENDAGQTEIKRTSTRYVYTRK